MSSMPDSPMLDTTGGSSSSSPSTANLPPIHVRVSEEQFTQMSFSNVHTQRPLEDGIGLMENQPMMGYNNAPIDNVTAVRNCQASSDDDRSDPGVILGYKKPPLPMQPLVIPLRGAGGYGLTSPDSIARYFHLLLPLFIYSDVLFDMYVSWSSDLQIFCEMRVSFVVLNR